MVLPNANELTALARAAMPTVLDAGAKSLLVLPIAALCVFCLRKSSAAIRHLVWFLAVVSLALLPLLTEILPAWHVLPPWTIPSNRSARDLKAQPNERAEVDASPNVTQGRAMLQNEPVLPRK